MEMHLISFFLLLASNNEKLYYNKKTFYLIYFKMCDSGPQSKSSFCNFYDIYI